MHVQGIELLPQLSLIRSDTSEFSETPNPAYFYANFSCCTHKKSFRRFFCTPVFSVSTCIIIVNFSLCSYQRRRLGVKISYCQQIKKITEALRLTAWCLSENGSMASTWHPRAAIASQKLAFYSESIQCRM